MTDKPYYDRRWRKRRDTFLKLHPLCVFCQKQGYVTAATVVDHIKPHRGDYDLFWDETNLQSLCSNCHASMKQRIENGKEVKHYGLDGWPI